MSSVALWIGWAVPLCCGLSAALTVLSLGWLRTAWPAPVRLPASVPWWLRLFWLPAQWMAKPLRTAPIAARLQHLQTQLVRCDLDGAIDAASWLMLRCLVGLSAAAVAALAALVLQVSMPLTVCAGGLSGWLLCGRWLAELRTTRQMQILKELPASLDVLTLCVEAGATLTAALRIVVDKSPPTPLRSVFERVLREVRAGRTRLEALEHVAAVYRLDCLDALVSALLQSEGAGISLGGLLRAQSEQRSAERHLRAERLALQAPVKMLGPLVLCIFPCTFVVISVPIVARLLQVTGP